MIRCKMLCDFSEDTDPYQCEIYEGHETDHVHLIKYQDGGQGICFFTIETTSFILSTGSETE